MKAPVARCAATDDAVRSWHNIDNAEKYLYGNTASAGRRCNTYRYCKNVRQKQDELYVQYRYRKCYRFCLMRRLCSSRMPYTRCIRHLMRALRLYGSRASDAVADSAGVCARAPHACAARRSFRTRFSVISARVRHAAASYFPSPAPARR